jgi:hypothetical protein
MAPSPPLTIDAAIILQSYLPAPLTVTRLLSIFHNRVPFCPTLSPSYVQSSVLPSVYGNLPPAAHNDGLPEFASLFALLGLAELFTGIDDASQRRAVHYADLSLAALGAVSVFERPSVSVVESLHARAQLAFALEETRPEPGLQLLSLALHTALAVRSFWIFCLCDVLTPIDSWGCVSNSPTIRN